MQRYIMYETVLYGLIFSIWQLSQKSPVSVVSGWVAGEVHISYLVPHGEVMFLMQKPPPQTSQISRLHHNGGENLS